MQNVITLLKKRNFIDAMTTDDLEKIASSPLKVYCGFDPTDASLHLGNFIPMMALAWFQRCGHTPYIILGGATGLIGDPSGKTHERRLLDEETVKKNVEGIKKNFENILDFNHPTCAPVFLNNIDWLNKFTFIEFLRDVGPYFRVGQMLAKESVRKRMDADEGLSFTEFSYQLLQSYDFYYLYKHYGVTMQIGGSDQWGNLTAGKEFVRKMTGETVHGLTFPLLMTSDGKKFGKSEKGAIWLSKERISPYQLYQYLVRTQDSDVIRLLRMLTFIDADELENDERAMQKAECTPNSLQIKLADAVTGFIHGQDGLKAAREVTAAAAPGKATTLDASSLLALSSDMPSYSLPITELLDQKLIDLIVHLGILKTKGEVRRLIRNGGVYLNEIKVDDENALVTSRDLIDSAFLLLAVGKKNKILISVKGKN